LRPRSWARSPGNLKIIIGLIEETTERNVIEEFKKYNLKK
jgi:hypothetical protein